MPGLIQLFARARKLDNFILQSRQISGEFSHSKGVFMVSCGACTEGGGTSAKKANRAGDQQSIYEMIKVVRRWSAIFGNFDAMARKVAKFAVIREGIWPKIEIFSKIKWEVDLMTVQLSANQ